MLDRAGDSPFGLPLPHATDVVGLWIGRPVMLGIRPECITEPGRNNEAGTLMARFQAPVDLVEPTGAENMILLKLGTSTALARADPRMRPAAGSTAEFAVDMSKACLFDPATELRIV